MKMLVPDADLMTDRDDFIWCVPIDWGKWCEMYALSKQFKCVTPGGLNYLHRIGKGRQQIVVALWSPPEEVMGPKPGVANAKSMDKLDVEAECAWLRLVKEVRQPIYIVPWGRMLTTREIMTRCVGVYSKMIQSLDSLTEPTD